jgi:hypothetical protein
MYRLPEGLEGDPLRYKLQDDWGIFSAKLAEDAASRHLIDDIMMGFFMLND